MLLRRPVPAAQEQTFGKLLILQRAQACTVGRLDSWKQIFAPCFWITSHLA